MIVCLKRTSYGHILTLYIEACEYMCVVNVCVYAVHRVCVYVCVGAPFVDMCAYVFVLV